MRPYIVPLLITAVALATAACGEDQDRPPTAPDFHTVVDQSSGCDFGHLDQLANSYFSPPLKQPVRDTLDEMETAFAADDFSATVKEHGFNVLAQIDAALNASTPTVGDPNVGSDLVNHLILCMYDPDDEASSYPETFPESFVIPLTPTSKGAFSVRPPEASNEVYSRPTNEPFSGISVSAGTWANTLAGNTPARVLFYGHPGSTSSTFDWKTLPRNATFAPEIVVAVCLDATTNTTALLNDEHQGLLPFVDAAFLDPATCSPTSFESAMLLREPMSLAKRLLQQGTGLLSPEPLMAAAFSPGGVGGRTSGIGTEYGPDDVTSVALAMGAQPTNTKVNQTICGQGPGPCPPVTVIATASLEEGGTDAIPNTAISVVAVTNNGATVVLSGTTTRSTDGDGIARFDNLTLNKTGSYRLVFAGSVTDRESIPVTGVTSAKFLERP